MLGRLHTKGKLEFRWEAGAQGMREDAIGTDTQDLDQIQLPLPKKTSANREVVQPA